MPSHLAFGWYSQSKAYYCGGKIYQEPNDKVGNHILRFGRSMSVTDVVDTPNHFCFHGDEVFVGIINKHHFKKRFPPVQKS